MTDSQTVTTIKPVDAKDGYTAMVEVAAAAMKATFMVPVEMMKFGFGMQMKMFSMMESMLPGADKKDANGDAAASSSSQTSAPSSPASPATTPPAAGWGPVTPQDPVSGWGPMPPHEVA